MEITTILKTGQSPYRTHEKIKPPKGFRLDIDETKMYKTTYLSPHQSRSKLWEYGFFLVKGCWLTENQIFLNSVSRN